MVRNSISREANVLKRYKTPIRPHIEYCTQARASAMRHGNWSGILRLIGRQKRVIKRIKDYMYRERLEKLEFTTLVERSAAICPQT